MSSSVIARQEIAEIAPRGQVNLLHFQNDLVLMVSSEAVGLYRDVAAVADPLGNGALGYEIIPHHLRSAFNDENGYIRDAVAGFVGLHSGAALFIRPDGVALYPDNQSALHNRDMQWLIPFPPAGG